MKIFETERLLFRHLEPGDLDDLYALYRDPEVRRFFPEGTYTREQTQLRLESYLQGYRENPTLGFWATILRETGEFIGRCGLLSWVIDGRAEIEIAYMLARQFWGRGLGTEAAEGIARYARDTLNINRLICLIDRENLASIRVAEKVGMAFENEGRDELGPYLLYSMSK